MIRCYLAKISQKRYLLHWFQYRNSYFEHPSVSENSAKSAKMACCLLHICGRYWCTFGWNTTDIEAISLVMSTVDSSSYWNKMSRYETIVRGANWPPLIYYHWEFVTNACHGPLTRYVKLWVTHASGMLGTFFPRQRRLAIPTCITARAWSTCRDACRDR